MKRHRLYNLVNAITRGAGNSTAAINSALASAASGRRTVLIIGNRKMLPILRKQYDGTPNFEILHYKDLNPTGGPLDAIMVIDPDVLQELAKKPWKRTLFTANEKV